MKKQLDHGESCHKTYTRNIFTKVFFLLKEYGHAKNHSMSLHSSPPPPQWSEIEEIAQYAYVCNNNINFKNIKLHVAVKENNDLE